MTPRWSYTSDYARNHTREASRSLDSLDLRDFAVTTNRTVTIDFEVVGLVESFVGVRRIPRPGLVEAHLPADPLRPDPPGDGVIRPGGRRSRFDFTLGLGNLQDEGDDAPQNLATNEAWSVSSGLVPIEGMQLRAGYQERETARQYFAERTPPTPARGRT